MEPAEIKLPACRYCIPLADESLGHEDLWSGETGQTEETYGPWLLAEKGGCRATECLAQGSRAGMLCLQPPSPPHHRAGSFCCAQYSPIFIGKSQPYKIRSFQPHLPFFLSDKLNAIKIEDEVYRTCQFPMQIICQKAKASVLFPQKDKWNVPILGQETINKAEIMGDHSQILHALEIFPLTFVTLKKVEFYVRNQLRNRDIHVLVLSLP